MGNKNQAMARKNTKSKIQGMKYSQEKQWDTVVGEQLVKNRASIPEKETVEEFLAKGEEITKCRYSGKGTRMKKSRYGTWKMDVSQANPVPMSRKTIKTIRRR